MESLGYIFLYFLRGSLPWQGLKAATKKQKYQKIAEVKYSTTFEELCRVSRLTSKNLKNYKITMTYFNDCYNLSQGYPYEFIAYLKHCRELRFDDSPDYTFLRSIFRKLFRRHYERYDYQFDWKDPDLLRNREIQKIKEKELYDRDRERDREQVTSTSRADHPHRHSHRHSSHSHHNTSTNNNPRSSNHQTSHALRSSQHSKTVDDPISTPPEHSSRSNNLNASNSKGLSKSKTSQQARGSTKSRIITADDLTSGKPSRRSSTEEQKKRIRDAYHEHHHHHKK